MGERIAVVAALGLVREVIPDAPLLVSEAYILAHRLDVVVHGDDLSDDSRRLWYGKAEALGKFRAVPYTGGICTTGLIDRVLLMYGGETRTRPAALEEAEPGRVSEGEWSEQA
jgi:glycerol-3-phosphate cytidylyltransferase-like family protein